MQEHMLKGVAPSLAEGWRLRSVSPARGFSGANGMRFDPAGRLHVASAFGSEIARVDLDSGAKTIVSPPGDEIVSPDDLAFDSAGRLFATECMDARVSVIDDGRVSVVADGLPGANGIGILEDRIFVDQFLLKGRLLEVYCDERPPRLIAEGLSGPNGLCVAPDRMIYFVQVFNGEIMRVSIDGGPVERFVDGLAAPTNVRVGPDGCIYCSENGSGKVTKVDIRTRERSTVVESRPGIDSLEVHPSGRVFISYYTDGAVLGGTGNRLDSLVDAGLLAPYGLALLGGELHIADGLQMSKLTGDGSAQRLSVFTDEGVPGFARGLAGGTEGSLYMSTSAGAVARYNPVEVTSEILVDGRAELMDVAVVGADVLVAEAGSGEVLRVGTRTGRTMVAAEGFDRPVGVAAAPNGGFVVTDEARGEAVAVAADGSRRVLLHDLNAPHGVAVNGNDVFIVEAGAKRLRTVSWLGVDGGVIAAELPVGAPGGGVRETQNGLPDMIPGPMPPFAGIAVSGDGRLYVSGDEIGSVLVIESAR
jgi:sugar lactone lactonase YvrE